MLSSYGGMYETGATTVIDVAAAGTYYGWVSATTGLVSGAGYVTFDDNATADRLTIGTSGGGVYAVTANVAYSGTANSTAICSVHVGGTRQEKCSLKRKLGAAGDVGSAGLTCNLSLAATNYLDLRCTADTNGDDVTIQEANLHIHRIGF